MVRASTLYNPLLAATLAAGNPVLPRGVDKLNPGAFQEAQQRDDAATRALANVQIKAADGRCLFVDALSGDFRANLTPLQIADCEIGGDGQGFDVITRGKHNDQQGRALVVSTLTQACLSFDPRRSADSQVHLFSCGGRADGGGQVSDSQLFAFVGGQVTVVLTPQNGPGQCLVAVGDKVIIAECDDKDDAQQFTFGGDAGKDGNATESTQLVPSSTATGGAMNVTVGPSSTPEPSKPVNITAKLPLPSSALDNERCSQRVVTVVNTVTVTMLPFMGTGVANGTLNPTGIFPTGTPTRGKKAPKIDKNISSSSTAINKTASKTISCNQGSAFPTGGRNATATTITRYPNGQHTANPTAAMPVSRAGGNLNATAAAAANQFDATAQRALESVNLRAADGRCMVIDPMAGDFRQNLIPVGLAECSEDPGQKFDVVTRGKHDDGKDGKALLVSVLTNGCLNFDSRRQQGDTVTMFSCGGRADGEGQTATSQLFPFDGSNNGTIVLQPASDGGKFCLAPGKDRLESASCDNQKDQVFELVQVLQSTADKLL